MTTELPRPNPAAGETLTFLSPATSTDLRLALDIRGVHHAPPAHVHPAAEERFTVTSGALEVRLGSRWTTLRPGDTAVVPAGVVHAYRNTSGDDVRVEVEVSPGAAMRGFFTDLFELAGAGRLGRTGGPTLPQAAALFRRHPGALTLPDVPVALQRVLWRVLAPFDRR